MHQPFAAALAIGIGLFKLVPMDNPLFVLVALLFLPTVALYLLMIFLPIPKFMKPRWYRDLVVQTWGQ